MAMPKMKTGEPLPAEPLPDHPGLGGVRLVAYGSAAAFHGALAALLIFVIVPAVAPPTPQEIPIIMAVAEPVIEEAPAPQPMPEEAAAPEPPPDEAPPPEPTPPEPPPPEPPPPEPEPPPPEPPPPEPPPPEPPPPEPPPPEPEPPPPEPPPPEPPPEPLPDPAPEPPPPPPEPRPEPPRPAPRPRPVLRPVQPRPATAPTTTAEPSPSPAPAPAPRAARPPPSYLQSVAAALERQKRYPTAALARRAAGVVMLQFTLLRDGRVAAWRIARSSGDADLDGAVQSMIQRANLPPMPSSMEVDSLEITVPLRFDVR